MEELGIEDASSIYEGMEDYLAQGIATAINLLNPQVAILGGGVAKSIDFLLLVINMNIHNYIVEGLVNK